MKRFFIVIAAMMASVASFATEYTDSMVTTEVGKSEQTLTITKAEDGTYTVAMDNWFAKNENDVTTYEGAFSISGLDGVTDDEGVTTISFENQDVTFTKGTKTGVAMWNLVFTFGGGNSVVHTTSMTLKFNDTKAYMEINVASSGMSGKAVGVFGTPFPVVTKYTDTMVTTGVGTSEQTLVVTKAADGTYTVAMDNWLAKNESDMTTYEGAFSISGLEGMTDDEGVTTISFEDQDVTFIKGTKTGVAMWNLVFTFGGGNSVVHTTSMTLKFNATKAYMEINVASSGMSGKAEGVFGTDEFGTLTSIQSVAKNAKAGIYTLDGVKVSEMQSGKIYIIRNVDGTSRKIMK